MINGIIPDSEVPTESVAVVEAAEIEAVNKLLIVGGQDYEDKVVIDSTFVEAQKIAAGEGGGGEGGEFCYFDV